MENIKKNSSKVSILSKTEQHCSKLSNNHQNLGFFAQNLATLFKIEQ
jgi:hypothetical protein